MNSFVAIILLLTFCMPLYAEEHDAIIEFGHGLRAAVYYPQGYLKLESERRWPALVFSHGFAGSALSQDVLLQKIASLGILVIAIEHSDPVAFERIPPRKGDSRLAILSYMRNHPFSHDTYNYRPREFVKLVEVVLTRFSVDSKQLVFAGHSMGGYTIFNAIKSSTVKPIAMIAYSVGELNYRRGRPYFTAAQLAAIKVPLLLVYGEQEFEKRRGAYAEKIHRHYGGLSQIVMLKGGGHLSYNDPSRLWGRQIRLQQISQVFHLTQTFLQDKLSGLDQGIVENGVMQ